MMILELIDEFTSSIDNELAAHTNLEILVFVGQKLCFIEIFEREFFRVQNLNFR